MHLRLCQHQLLRDKLGLLWHRTLLSKLTCPFWVQFFSKSNVYAMPACCSVRWTSPSQLGSKMLRSSKRELINVLSSGGLDLDQNVGHSLTKNSCGYIWRKVHRTKHCLPTVSSATHHALPAFFFTSWIIINYDADTSGPFLFVFRNIYANASTPLCLVAEQLKAARSKSTEVNWTSI